MLPTHAVGIDLGTTYSCIAHLNEHGEPVTLANQEGEQSTPSVVLFDGDEIVVGTEALRHAIVQPEKVIQHAKRYMGEASKRWVVGGRPYTPVDVSSYILRKLIAAAQERIGPIERAVVTVPAQFSDSQRHATVMAAYKAGLREVDLINEPVAAALCHVLGSEGLWFTELAEDQTLLVYDLGGGTFDLSLVRYQKNQVRVIASVGDLNLGGLDWNEALLDAIAKQFRKDFDQDPRDDASSRQALALEVEQTKRSLSVRPKSTITVQHAGHRKAYQVEQGQFEKLTRPLVDRTAKIVKKLLKDLDMGWAKVDVVMTTGGASRMPMVRNMLKDLSGRTLNTTLSPDQSIAHGATYYAGMLLTNSKFARSILNEKATQRLASVRQQSVTARGLGILVRDMNSGERVPHYLIAANTPLPAQVTKRFGTVSKNQRRVNLRVVESGTDADKPPVQLGECRIDDLPPNLPEGSEIDVTIRYDESARVHVGATDVTSGKRATAEIIRQENLVPQLAADHLNDSYSQDTPDDGSEDAQLVEDGPATGSTSAPRVSQQRPAVQNAPKHSPRPSSQSNPSKPSAEPDSGTGLEDAEEPILLDEFGEPMNDRLTSGYPNAQRSQAGQEPPPVPAKSNRPAQGSGSTHSPQRKPVRRRSPAPQSPPPKKPDAGEDEFWNLSE